MPTELLLAPVGAGKTDRALAALVDTLNADPFAKIWVLLPTRRQTDAFRQRLIDYDPNRRVYFNVEFFDFYTLYARLLDLAGQPQRELDDAARTRLLREILADLREDGELEFYEPIADKPGFIEIVADFIYQLKQNVILPDDFGMATNTPKDRDLAKIYATYQDQLRRHDLVDREGEGWLALTVVGDNPDYQQIGRDVSLLVVDGFDQFNRLQAQLLALLASRAKRTLVTLATVPGRERTVGRRFEEARRLLGQVHATLNVPIVDSPVAAAGGDTRTPALRYLVDNIFSPVPAPRSSEGALSLIEAPDPAQEAAAVLRAVKWLLLTQDAQPDDILIAMRDWGRYARYFAALGRAYRIPLSLHYGEPVIENPAVIALLNLIELHEHDFRRRELFDVLRSPYFRIQGFDKQWIDLLEKVSQAQLVIGGRDEWLVSIERATARPVKDDDEIERFTLEESLSQHLRLHLSAFFDAVTPPRNATIGDYVTWLEDLFGSDMADPEDEQGEAASPLYTLHLFGQLRETTDDQGIISRDLSAMRAFKSVLRNLLAAQSLFTALGLDSRNRQEWGVFSADLKTALKAAAINRDNNRTGKILVTTVSDARGMPHRHIFIPGLSEGLFPAPANEDPLYLDTERTALTARGIPLETSAERVADEGLFYELISQAVETLTLSRPTVQNGALWPSSHLWRAVCDLFSDARELIEQNQVRLGGVLPAAEAATFNEAALSAAHALNQATLNAPELKLYNWLVTQRHTDWRQIRLGRSIELSRMGRGGFDRYSGRLSDPGLIDWAADALGQSRVWSASQFNDYAMCGFRFFAKRLLKLESLEEPEDGMDAAQLGTINHAILEETYERLRRMNTSISADNTALALTTLQQVAEEVLRDAPTEIGFRASVLWEQEKVTLLRKLEKLILTDFSDDSPVSKHYGGDTRYPYRLESPFSDNTRNVIEIDLETGLEPLRVTGYIDRMDRQGDRVILMDYKSGSTKIPTKEMREGRNFQMMLYLQAAEQILAADPDPDRPKEIAGGMFWHLQNQETSGQFSWNEPEDEAALQSAKEHLTGQIQRGRAGEFGIQPGKGGHGPCAHYCEFNQLCRVNIVHRSKIRD